MSDDDQAAVASLLKTGDVVLFEAPARGYRLLRWLRRHAWTHVGLVLRGPEDPEPLLWEGRGEGTRPSTIVARLAARIASFPGRVSVRCLNHALAAGQCARLDALRRELAARAPQGGLLDLMAAADGGWLGPNPDDLGVPTGGELVAVVYQRLGLLSNVDHGGLPPSRYRARRFAEQSGLRLKHGYALGPEVLLHDPARALEWRGASPQPA